MLTCYIEACLWLGRLTQSSVRCGCLPCLRLAEAKAVAQSAQLPLNSMWDWYAKKLLSFAGVLLWMAV